jgi:hypothetical protein
LKRPTALAGVLALFLVGVLVGVLGSNLFLHHRPHPAGGGGLGGLGRRGTAEELRRRLDLNADQQRQVDAILADGHRQVAAIWHEVAPRVMASVDQSFDRIAQILNPHQREELERYRHEHLGAMRRQHAAPSPH